MRITSKGIRMAVWLCLMISCDEMCKPERKTPEGRGPRGPYDSKSPWDSYPDDDDNEVPYKRGPGGPGNNGVPYKRGPGGPYDNEVPWGKGPGNNGFSSPGYTNRNQSQYAKNNEEDNRKLAVYTEGLCDTSGQLANPETGCKKILSFLEHMGAWSQSRRRNFFFLQMDKVRSYSSNNFFNTIACGIALHEDILNQFLESIKDFLPSEQAAILLIKDSEDVFVNKISLPSTIERLLDHIKKWPPEHQQALFKGCFKEYKEGSILASIFSSDNELISLFKACIHGWSSKDKKDLALSMVDGRLLQKNSIENKLKDDKNVRALLDYFKQCRKSSCKGPQCNDHSCDCGYGVEVLLRSDYLRTTLLKCIVADKNEDRIEVVLEYAKDLSIKNQIKLFLGKLGHPLYSLFEVVILSEKGTLIHPFLDILRGWDKVTIGAEEKLRIDEIKDRLKFQNISAILSAFLNEAASKKQWETKALQG